MPTQRCIKLIDQSSARITSYGRAVLWANNPDVTAILPKLFAHVGMVVVTVSSSEEMLDAASHARPNDILVIDCATAFDAVDRCTAVVGHTAVTTYICHPDKDFVDDLRLQAHGSLYWLPPAWLGLSLLQKLRTFQAQATASLSHTNHIALSDREYEVWQSVAEGLSNQQIADRLYISRSTVKAEVNRVKQQLELETRADPIKKYHNLTQNRTIGS